MILSRSKILKVEEVREAEARRTAARGPNLKTKRRRDLTWMPLRHLKGQ